MKNAMLISIRGSHLDDFPAELVLKGIQFLHKNFPELPLTLCFEGDPNYTLDANIAAFKHKLGANKSRFPGREYTQDESEHDKSNYWLLLTAKEYKLSFVLTDLKDIETIPLGDPRIEDLKVQRESTMTRKLAKAADLNGGIIFDFGGFNHSSNIQKLLLQNKSFVNQHQAKFFCAYSKSGQKHMPSNFRLMRFQGVPEEQYPLGLDFLTFDYPEQQNVLEDALARTQAKEAVFERVNKMLANFAGTLLNKSICTTNMQAQSATEASAAIPLVFSSNTGCIDLEQQLLDRALRECMIKKDGGKLPEPEVALRRAAYTGKLEIVKTLVTLVKSLNINQPGPESGKTALDFAHEKDENQAVIEFLESNGAKSGKKTTICPN